MGRRILPEDDGQGRRGGAEIHGQTETDWSHKSPGSVQYKSEGKRVDATGGHKYDLAGRDLQQLIENYFPAIVTARSRRSFVAPRLIFPRVTREGENPIETDASIEFTRYYA